MNDAVPEQQPDVVPVEEPHPGPSIAGAAFANAFTGRASGTIDGRQPSWGEVHLRLLERLAPPSILVDNEYDVVHISPTAGRFLQFSGGEPSRNLLRAV